MLGGSRCLDMCMGWGLGIGYWFCLLSDGVFKGMGYVRRPRLDLSGLSLRKSMMREWDI